VDVFDDEVQGELVLPRRDEEKKSYV